VFSGSILGLSLINSVFINEMSSIADDVEDNDKSIENLKTQIELLNSKQDKIMEQLNRLIEESKDEKK
jgi:uncharacterized protein YoxC